VAIIHCWASSVPKAGNSFEENEDAYRISGDNDTEVKQPSLRCAISDGATRTSFSKLWAGLLVDAAVSYVPSNMRFCKILSDAQVAWREDLSQRDLPWHAVEKVKTGSFATLLWLSLRYYKSIDGWIGKWKTLAFGDTNLFHLRQDGLVRTYPLVRSAQFDRDPLLLSSLPQRNTWIEAPLRPLQGQWSPGDEFILATDALARYLMQRYEVGQDLSILLQERLGAAGDQEAFKSWIGSLRSEGLIKNDDTTLVWIQTFESSDLIQETGDVDVPIDQ
jgi:hypothetical protein